jgi:hypothetical protein
MTQAQLDSNRQNSQLSTGPRTEAGKLASSKNATAHGLAAADPVLSYESRDEFFELVKINNAEFDPKTHHEKFLVTQITGAEWRLARVQRIENAAMDLLILGPGDETTNTPDHKLAQRFLDSGGDPLPRLERYRASIERSYHRAKKELKAEQKQQKQNEAQLQRAKAYLDERAIHVLMNAPIPGYEPGIIAKMCGEKWREAAAQQTAS